MSTKKTKLVLANGAMVMAMAMAMVGGAMAVDVTVNASATVVEALKFENPDDLSFGAFIPSSTATGTVVITTNGNRNSTNGVVLTGSNGYGPATFIVTGSANTSYNFALPKNNDVVLAGRGSDMRVTDFNVALAPDRGTSTGALKALTGADGTSVTQKFNYGATLQVGSAQAPGVYTGVFGVTVIYD